jgi:hypothetical protein
MELDKNKERNRMIHQKEIFKPLDLQTADDYDEYLAGSELKGGWLVMRILEVDKEENKMLCRVWKKEKIGTTTNKVWVVIPRVTLGRLENIEDPTVS